MGLFSVDKTRFLKEIHTLFLKVERAIENYFPFPLFITIINIALPSTPLKEGIAVNLYDLIFSRFPIFVFYSKGHTAIFTVFPLPSGLEYWDGSLK